MGITIYFGGCWSTNIGNAFIDIGALESCKKYNPYLYSEYDYIMFGQNRNMYFNTFLDLNPKCVFFSGMVMSRQFLIDQKEILKEIDSRGIPIVLNGVGGEEYSSAEIHSMRNFCTDHNFAGFISRDKATYDTYGDLFKKSYCGIDVAFFMSDANRFNALVGLEKKYIVVNEDDLGFNQNIKRFAEYKSDEVITTHHQLTSMPKHYTASQRTMISELPDGFLSMYAMSKVTFSTRVHACVATLAFGGKAMLAYKTPRSLLFERVGAEKICSEPVCLDMDLLAQRKKEHMSAIDDIMKDICST